MDILSHHKSEANDAIKESFRKFFNQPLDLRTCYVDACARTPHPRILKSHFDFSLLDPNALDTAKVKIETSIYLMQLLLISVKQ